MNGKIWVSAGIIGLLFGFTGAQAQSGAEQASASDAAAIEEVIVRGYRGSLKAALDIKRRRGRLYRLHRGDRYFGSGRPESCRSPPTSAWYSRCQGTTARPKRLAFATCHRRSLFTSINQLATTSAVGREVDFSVFASEIVQKVTVRKSPLASEEEGGVAGTINITTARPFDYDGFSFAGSVEAAYNDYSEEIRSARLIPDEQYVWRRQVWCAFFPGHGRSVIQV